MSRHNPEKIETIENCFYGCNTIGKYRFKSGKICCSDAIQKCQGHINAVKKSNLENVDEFGLNTFQRGQKNANISRLKTNSYKEAGKKISYTKNKKIENGLRNCDISNAKMKQTKLLVGEDGLTNAQRSARKMADKRLNDIDDYGLNQYQRWTKDRVENDVFNIGFEKAKLIKNIKY